MSIIVCGLLHISLFDMTTMTEVLSVNPCINAVNILLLISMESKLAFAAPLTSHEMKHQSSQQFSEHKVKNFQRNHSEWDGSELEFGTDQNELLN